MDRLLLDSIAPAAAVQLTTLAAALVGVLAVALPVALWSRRRRRSEASTAVVVPVASPLLPGAALIALLALPAAVAIRQLWPHPDLGVRLLLGWLVLVVPGVAAWLVRARS